MEITDTAGGLSQPVSGSYQELAGYIEVARRNWTCAAHLLMNIDDAQREAAIHLLRAWHAVAAVHAVEAGRPAPSLSDAVSSLDASRLSFSRHLPQQIWEADLRVFEQVLLEPVWLANDCEGLSLTRLRYHANFLEDCLIDLARSVRRKFGMTLFRRNKRRFAVLGIVALMLLCAFGVYRLIQGPPPWRAQFFDNANLAGQARQLAKHRDIDFAWDTMAPFDDFPRDEFSARWDTCFYLDSPRNVLFSLSSDDGSRVLLDGRLVLDHWGVHPQSLKAQQLSVEPGPHHLIVEYFEMGGGAWMTFKAEDTATSESLLTRKYLKQPGKDGEICGQG